MTVERLSWSVFCERSALNPPHLPSGHPVGAHLVCCHCIQVPRKYNCKVTGISMILAASDEAGSGLVDHIYGETLWGACINQLIVLSNPPSDTSSLSFWQFLNHHLPALETLESCPGKPMVWQCLFRASTGRLFVRASATLSFVPTCWTTISPSATVSRI